MARLYVTQSWVGCAEDSYSGEQIGNRNSKSVGVHMYRDGDTYKANLAAYADGATDKKKQPSAYDKIMQDERKYDELEELSLALDKQYLDMQIDDEQYHSAKSVIEDKMYKQWQKLAKAKNWKYDPVYDSIENPNQPVEVDRNIQLEKPVGFWQYVFNGLDDSNLFKQFYCKLKGI